MLERIRYRWTDLLYKKSSLKEPYSKKKTRIMAQLISIILAIERNLFKNKTKVKFLNDIKVNKDLKVQNNLVVLIQ